jgi:hypothetical protein
MGPGVRRPHGQLPLRVRSAANLSWVRNECLRNHWVAPLPKVRHVTGSVCRGATRVNLCDAHSCPRVPTGACEYASLSNECKLSDNNYAETCSGGVNTREWAVPDGVGADSIGGHEIAAREADAAVGAQATCGRVLLECHTCSREQVSL